MAVPTCEGTAMEAFFSFLSGPTPLSQCLPLSRDASWWICSIDGVRVLAYLWMPVAILRLVHKQDWPFSRVVAIACALLLACALTQLAGLTGLWQLYPDLFALAETVTDALAVATGIALWNFKPVLRTSPDNVALAAELEAEIRLRKTAEEKVLDYQAAQAAAFNRKGVGFISTDREGNVTTLNAVAQALLEWTEQEARGQPLWTVFPYKRPLAWPPFDNEVDYMVRQGLTVETIHREMVASHNGRRTPVDVSSELIRQHGGEVTGLEITILDATHADAVELRVSQLAAIVESSNDAIVGKTLAGTITSWNLGAERLFGYTSEEAVGQQVQMLIPEERLDEEMRIITQLALGRTVAPFDTVRLAKTGELVEVSISVSPIRDRDGRVVGASKIARDVSAERRAQRALQESEERLRFTLEAAQIGDWSMDLLTGEVIRSLRHDQCFGYRTAIAAWSPATFVEHVHREDRNLVEQDLSRAIDQQRSWGVECRVVWPDGTLHWISAKGDVQRRGDKAVRLLGIIVDITERREAEAARIKAARLESENLQIQAANRLKSQFVANMSHELRTPLNAVIGFAEILETGTPALDSMQAKEFLGYIGRSGHHLLQLINDVLDLSKVEAGKFQFYPEDIDLERLCSSVADLMKPAMRDKHLQYRVVIDPQLSGLKLDPRRLKQVLFNYLSNACKFSANGGRVTLRAFPEGLDRFRIEVQDSGIGIAPADISRLFKEFQQLDAGTDKRYEGTGLGLALTKRLVESQGGSVGARSVLGVGSVFHVVLDRRPRESLPTKDVALDAALKRALVIDAKSHEQDRLVSDLRASGYEVHVAYDELDALAKAREIPYTALTLGLTAGGRSFDVLDHIRSHGQSQASPVKVVTTPDGAGLTAGFAVANVLSKPLRSEEILGVMSSLARSSDDVARVMVIDDDPLARELMRATLISLGAEAVCFENGMAALVALKVMRPAAVVLDLMMPEMDGFEVLDALATMPAARDIPVYIWTSLLLTDREYARLTRSARAILLKGGGGIELALDTLKRWQRPALQGAPEACA